MKILMAAMSLDIGGAETHIVELSKALRRHGHDVHVVSGGGVYVKELEKFDIAHTVLPLNRRNVLKMLQAYRGLKKLIKKEKFDVVHAHARIPGFICSLVAKSNKSFKFVTTAHGVYSMGTMGAKIASWGQRALAVSCDVKEYLIGSYGVPTDNVSLTVNGIDTIRFSPDADGSGVISEFGMSKDCRHRIVYVSRIDEASAHVAFMLAELAPRFVQKYPDAEILLAGGGNVFSKLEETAERINSQLYEKIGRKVVFLTGARTDIAEICATSTVFVGVSRALLEAMAEEKAVVAAGSQGYLGIITPEITEAAISTNFCARDCDFPVPENLFADLCKQLDLTDEKRRAQGKYNRETVISYYSIDRMREDAEELYLSTPVRRFKRRNGIMISGYYGFGNNGDDTLLQTITDKLRRDMPDSEITVLSNNPKQTAHDYGVRSVNRFSPFGIIFAMLRSKLFISGGGTLLADNTSTRSLMYYTFVIRLAKLMGLKTVIYASGIGPVSTPKNRKRVVKAVKVCDEVSLREKASKLELEAYMKECGGVKDSDYAKITVTSDPAFALKLPQIEWKAHICRREGLADGKKYFALAVRPWKLNPEDFDEQIAESCREISKKYGLTPIFIAMQRTTDLPLIEKIVEKIPELEPIVASELSASEIASIFEKCEFIVGMRLHSIIYATVAGTPAICISYDPKVNAIADEIGLPHRVPAEGLTSVEIVEKCRLLLENK